MGAERLEDLHEQSCALLYVHLTDELLTPGTAVRFDLEKVLQIWPYCATDIEWTAERIRLVAQRPAGTELIFDVVVQHTAD